MDNEYYVYAYYYKSTGSIFYIGKGKGNRYIDLKHSRNRFFLSIIEKYPDDIAVKFILLDMSNEDACTLEKVLIQEYKDIGQCEANFHEGGNGGNTGNYQLVSLKLKKWFSENKRSEKWYESVKLAGQNRKGDKTSELHKMNTSIGLKRSWEDRTSPGNIARLKNLQKTLFKRGDIPYNKGKTTNKLSYVKMMNKDCPYKYEVYFNLTLIYWTISSQKLLEFLKDVFNISRTIMHRLIANDWKPTFNKHKHLESLKIIRLYRGVSTNRDECNDVEWKLQPLEVLGNLNNKTG